jgi:hypothetical protein
MITFIIQKSLIHLHPLGVTNRLDALGVQHCEPSCMRVYNIFLDKITFFGVLPKVHGIGLCCPINLYATQSTSTSATPSTSRRNNSGMHCYIGGEASKFVFGTKFETSYSNVSSAHVFQTLRMIEKFVCTIFSHFKSSISTD